MDSKALFGAKTIACISVFVQLPRPLTCSNFVLASENTVQCTQTIYHNNYLLVSFLINLSKDIELNMFRTKDSRERLHSFYIQ